MSTSIIGLIILFLVIVLFLINKTPSYVTVLIGCSLYVLLCGCKVNDVFIGFSDSIIILVASMMVVGLVFEEVGLSRLVGQEVIKLSKGNERRFLLIGCCVAYIMSAFMSNTAVNALFITIIITVCLNSHLNELNLILPIVISTIIGGVSTLIGSTPQLTAQGILKESTSIEFKMFDFTLAGLIIFLVFLLYSQTIGYSIGKKIWGNRENILLDVNKNLNTFKKDKAVIFSIIFLIMLIFFIGAWVEISIVALVGALLCLILKLIDYSKAIKGINWSVIITLGGCLGISKALQSCGSDVLLTSFVKTLINPISNEIIILAIFVFMAMVVSNFLSNSATVLLFLPIALNLGINQKLMAVAIVFASSLAFSTPLANAQVSMSLSAGYKFSDYIKYTWILDLLILTIIITLFPLIY